MWKRVLEVVSISKGCKGDKTGSLAYSHLFQAKQADKLGVHKRTIVIYAPDMKSMQFIIREECGFCTYCTDIG